MVLRVKWWVNRSLLEQKFQCDFGEKLLFFNVSIAYRRVKSNKDVLTTFWQISFITHVKRNIFLYNLDVKKMYKIYQRFGREENTVKMWVRHQTNFLRIFKIQFTFFSKLNWSFSMLKFFNSNFKVQF
jgi:hypothetical protein